MTNCVYLTPNKIMFQLYPGSPWKITQTISPTFGLYGSIMICSHRPVNMVIHVLYMHSKVLLYNIRVIAQILLNNVTTVIQYQNSCNYEKKLWTVKQWWSTIPPISTKRAITSHLHSLNTKKGNHDIWLGNLGPSLGQSQKCGGYWISKGNKYINKREKKNLHIFAST